MLQGNPTTHAQRTRGRNPHERPQPIRIAGIAGAIAINATLFMLMLAPLRSPEPPPLPEPNPQFEWIQPRVEPPPLPPLIVPVTAPQPRSAQPPPRPLPTLPSPAVQASIDVAPTADHAMTAPEPALDLASGPAIGAAGAGARLEYLVAPPPVYPRDMLAAGIEGSLVLEVLVGTDGRPLKVTVHESSGQRALDEAARRQVLRHWKFRPAMEGGQAVRAVGLVPIAFSLGR